MKMNKIDRIQGSKIVLEPFSHKFINDEYNDWIAGNYKKSPIDNIDFLSRESLTKKLLDIIYKINS